LTCRRIFAAKALASLTVIMLLAAGLAASGVVGGLAAVGNQPLVGLDGHLLAPGQAAGAVLLAWATVLAPTLAFAAVGLLGSRSHSCFRSRSTSASRCPRRPRDP
jgi:ABC-2 type transport system permease protein